MLEEGLPFVHEILLLEKTVFGTFWGFPAVAYQA